MLHVRISNGRALVFGSLLQHDLALSSGQHARLVYFCEGEHTSSYYDTTGNKATRGHTGHLNLMSPDRRR